MLRESVLTIAEIPGPDSYPDLASEIAGFLASNITEAAGEPYHAECVLTNMDAGRTVAAFDPTGSVIGAGVLYPQSRHRGTVSEIAVEAQHRHTGIGREILQLLECIANRDGLTELILDALPSSNDFYTKQGYEETMPETFVKSLSIAK